MRIQEETLHQLDAVFARMESRLTSIESKIDSLLSLKTDFARCQQVLEEMARNQEIFLRRWAHHDDMMMDHERRLGRSKDSRLSRPRLSETLLIARSVESLMFI